MPLDREIFVQNIKKWCVARNVKPTVACKEAGVGGSFISDINRGQVPSVAKVQSLATYLGVTTSELLGEKKNGSGAVSDADSSLTEMDRLVLSLPSERREEVLRYMKYLATQSGDH